MVRELRELRTPDDLPQLEHLFRAVHAADGHWPLGEQKYLDLQRGLGRESEGVVALVDGRIHGYLHLTPNRDPGGWGMELAIDPDVRDRPVLEALLAAAQGRVRAADGSSLSYWLYNQEPPPALAEHGFEPDRELHQLRRRLPVDEQAVVPAGFEVRGFRPGHDEEQWLRVNNRAFAGHPENGNWTAAILAERMAVDWFDPDGLRTAWHGDQMAAFNWTKVHHDGSGEIYVIAVHPEFQGQGLGRAIAVDGLDHLHRVGGCGEASLYVDAANVGGLALYNRLGFELDHTDRAFRWTVPTADVREQ